MAKQAIALMGYYQKSHPFIYDKNISLYILKIS